jgi:hypothetical protein
LSSPWKFPYRATRPGMKRSWRHAYDLWKRKARPRARPGLRHRPSRGTEGVDATMARCLHLYQSCYAVWRLVIVRVSAWWTVDKHGEMSEWWWVDCLTGTGVLVGETFTCGCAVQKQRIEVEYRDMI